MFEGLEKISYERIIIYILVFVATISPGILILYLFQPALFYSLPTSKLILLALSFTIPFLLFNTILAVNHMSGEEYGEELYNIAIMIGSFFTASIFYLSMVLSHYLPLKWLTLKISLIGLQAIIFIASFEAKIEKNQAEKRKKA